MTAKKISELTEATEAQLYNDIVLPIVSDGVTLKAAARSALFWALVPDGAGVHNGICRGKNITTDFNSGAFSTNVANGTFRNIFIGDYIIKEMTSSLGGTETVKWIVADLDWFLRCGSTDVTAHHVVLVPEDCFRTATRMNSSNTTTGAYVGSEMYTTSLPAYATAVTNAFGSAHILSHTDLFATTMTAATASMAGGGLTGASTGWDWQSDRKIDLLSEPMVYGGTVCSSSFYDVGCGKSQLALFRLRPDLIQCGSGYNSTGRSDWWLRAVASSTTFALIDATGYASRTGASHAAGLRPFILIK